MFLKFNTLRILSFLLYHLPCPLPCLLPCILLFSLLLPSPLSSKPIISEIYFETKNSKYYNQAIEIVNHGTTALNLTNYYLVAEAPSHTNSSTLYLTNYLHALTSSQQIGFSNATFDPILSPGGISVILDSGYIGRFQENYQFKQATVLTVTNVRLGLVAFINDKNKFYLKLKNDPLENPIDEFHLLPSPTGYSVNRLNRDAPGNTNNLILAKATIGELLSKSYTDHPPTELVFELENPNKTKVVIGQPTRLFILCKYQSSISTNCNQTLYLNELDDFSLFYEVNGNLNRLNTKDGIVIQQGQSTPLIGFAKTLTQHLFTLAQPLQSPYQSLNVNALSITSEDFTHPLSSSAYFSEIYYNTDKNLTWIEVYFPQPITLDSDLQLTIYNSSYETKTTFSLPPHRYSGWQVFANLNDNFKTHHSWWNKLSPPIIPLSDRLEITASGVLKLSSLELGESQIIDIAHYNKDWVNTNNSAVQLPPYSHSLQRFTFLPNQYGFDKTIWLNSDDLPTTPGEKNIQNISYPMQIKLSKTLFSASSSKLPITVDITEKGILTANLYLDDGSPLGLLYNREVKRGQQQHFSICLKKVPFRNGGYSLDFTLTPEDANQPATRLTRSFIIHGY